MIRLGTTVVGSLVGSGVIVLGLFISATLGGCGAPSSLDICHESCEMQQRCSQLKTQEVHVCHSTCDAQSVAYKDGDAAMDRDCQNGPEVRKALAHCLEQVCSQVESCSRGVDIRCLVR